MLQTDQHEMFKNSRGSISFTACETTTTAVFNSYNELKGAVEACLKLSAKGHCSNSQYGPIGDWDVSRVTFMRGLFTDANSFNADISKWDVSHVTDMSYMFQGARLFNGDLSNWDVSRVTAMKYMFGSTSLFNRDISKWDMSNVMDDEKMFLPSPNVVSYVPPRATDISPKGDCSLSSYGPIGDWDVTSVKDMSSLFANSESFNGDISKWDVSRVTNMSGMFNEAKSFKGDISQWNV